MRRYLDARSLSSADTAVGLALGGLHGLADEQAHQLLITVSQAGELAGVIGDQIVDTPAKASDSMASKPSSAAIDRLGVGALAREQAIEHLLGLRGVAAGLNDEDDAGPDLAATTALTRHRASPAACLVQSF